MAAAIRLRLKGGARERVPAMADALVPDERPEEVVQTRLEGQGEAYPQLAEVSPFGGF